MIDELNIEEIELPLELKGRQWLSFSEFGSLLGLKVSTIRSWKRKGIIKAQQFSPRCYMIHKSEVDRLYRGELMENNPIDPQKGKR